MISGPLRGIYETLEQGVQRNERTSIVRGRPSALIEHSNLGESVEASGTCRRSKFHFPMPVVLDELSICVATEC